MKLTINNFTDALLQGDHAKSLSIVNKWRDNYTRFYIYNKLITPAMYEIGRRWQANEISVAQEHLATAVCDFVLTQTEHDLVRYSPAPEATPKALFFTVEDEHHYLGMKMVSILFREKQWNVKYYQSNLPVDHVMNEIVQWKPGVIGLSFSIVHRANGLTSYLKKFSELDYEPEILVGGRLMNQYDFSSIGPPNTTFIQNLEELDHWFNQYTENRRDDLDGDKDTTSII
ncbi:B12-binding domain-containing protein [Salipaludibacillus sp. CUR1]|uniref:cobalamin B12-binding domain-containing protein n=1 Tax=Salipaludibacillus sp. CUR1 TaxID=2820003 RepID=UPI001E56043F|nr:B12-binding domain-containing protein [Salipaludibacillus sp. CUR1]MCE7792360.1 B12-binding domain-containing protein [Salipaludibacillus sp. CUR1]